MKKTNDWKWTMKDDYPKETNGLKVFSCFACGGGSTMGYKLAGCEVLGCCDIDPQMNEVYVENHHPKYNYLMDIRDFNKLNDLPKELYELDILDGSPPCTTFSIIGKREKTWGVKKKFREGQKEQTLDDLLFVFIETVGKLRPKVAIMENVQGLLQGKATVYVDKVYDEFAKIGYKVKHWLLKSETMGVPQTRHRVFFIATRLDFDLNQLNMGFNYTPVTYGDIKEGVGPANQNTLWYDLLGQVVDEDKTLADVRTRLGLPYANFGSKLCREKDMLPTITANLEYYDPKERTKLSVDTIRNATTFPQDFNFCGDSPSHICYVCGMSVPPIMMKRVATRLIESGIFKEDK